MIQVGDGGGIDQHLADEVLARIACEIRKTSDSEKFRALLMQALQVGAAKRTYADDIVVHFPRDQIVTFPAAMVGEPPGPWHSLKEHPPTFYGCYWIQFRGKTPFVASYDNKGWEMVDVQGERRINSQYVDGWKELWRNS